MSTTDDTTSTSTPDATLDPVTVAEVEQALDAAVQAGPVRGGGVARPNGGIGHAETIEPTDLMAPATGGIGHPEDPKPGDGVPPGVQADTGGIGHPEGPKPDGVARPHGGIGHAETARP